jgi:hypothetical protein
MKLKLSVVVLGLSTFALAQHGGHAMGGGSMNGGMGHSSGGNGNEPGSEFQSQFKWATINFEFRA